MSTVLIRSFGGGKAILQHQHALGFKSHELPWKKYFPWLPHFPLSERNEIKNDTIVCYAFSVNLH